ncbi:MAG: hypothetical protein GY772_00530 [bacterium]|nr:hypothetical protein [bacterium]
MNSPANLRWDASAGRDGSKVPDCTRIEPDLPMCSPGGSGVVRLALVPVIVAVCVGLLGSSCGGSWAEGALSGPRALTESIAAVQSLRFEDLANSRSPERVRRSLRPLERIYRSLDPTPLTRRLQRAERRYLRWQREVLAGIPIRAQEVQAVFSPSPMSRDSVQ